jgi:hypothetical protein
MEKVKCGIRARWTGNGEGRMRRLRPREHRPENGSCATHIGHMKSKSTCVMKMASTNKSRWRTIAQWHLVEATHAST